jgi:hypothetical protein
MGRTGWFMSLKWGRVRDAGDDACGQSWSFALVRPYDRSAFAVVALTPVFTNLE